jgi:hypothetical protein
VKGRKQKISKDTCPQKDRAALESYAGGQTFLWMTESEDTRENVERNMLEYVLSPANLNAAYKQVVRNKGAGGIDRMEVEELKDYLIAHKEALLQTVLSGTYQPQAVKRVEIPKSDVSKLKFQGYSFYHYKGKCRLRVHPKSVRRMKERIRAITSRSNGKGDAWRKEACSYFIRGWVNYYRAADMKSLLSGVDEWYRSRLRMVIWKQWKRIKTKMTNLIKLGIKKSKAWEYANTRKDYWHTANSPILSTAITNERLRRAGYIFFTDYYLKVTPVN